MESEGPYTSGLPDNAAVVDNRLGRAYTGIEERSVNAVCSWMNEAHAHGRKAERDRCAKIAEREPVNQDEWGNIVFGLGEKIAEKIRGVHDVT